MLSKMIPLAYHKSVSSPSYIGSYLQWQSRLWIVGLLSLCICSGCGPRLESTGMTLYDEMPVIWEIFAVAFSPEGDRVLAGGNSGPVNPADRAVDVWRFPAGTATRPFAGAVNCLSVGIDNQMVVGGYYRLELWDYASARLVRSFDGHDAMVTAVAFSPDNRFVLSGTSYLAPPEGSWLAGECLIRLWDVRAGVEIQRFKGHRSPIGAVAFLPNRKQILSASVDKTMRLWDIESGEELMRMGTERPPKTSVDDGKSQVVVLDPEAKYRESLDVTQDGRFVLRGLTIWDLEQWTIHQTFGDAHIAPANCSVFSPDERRILSAHTDGRIRLWERATGVEIGSAMVFRNKTVVNSVAFSPDGRFAVSGGSGYEPYFGAVVNDLPTVDRYVRIWSMPD